MRLLPQLTETQLQEQKVKEEQYKGLLKVDEKTGMNLLGLQQEHEKEKLQQSLTLMGDQTKVVQEAYKSALRGVDEDAAANRAKADVAMGFSDATMAMRRDMGRQGLNTGGQNYAASMAGLARDRAKSQAGAMTQARTGAQTEEFQRLATTIGLTTK
jgi:hypothetical protein